MPKLFGPDRIRPGDPTIEWAVWLPLMDDSLPAFDRITALEMAALHNAQAAARYDGTPATVSYAVVLHWGYAWRPDEDRESLPSCREYTEPY